MSSFFRICIYICLGLICFNLALICVDALGVFPFTQGIGTKVNSTSGALESIAGYENNMGYLWGLIVVGGAVGVGVGILTSSFIPVGISIFGSIFWATYIRTIGIVSVVTGDYLPGEFLIIFTVVMVFIFIAAIIGMITGSG